MIVFLTVIYVALLLLAFKLGWIKPTLAWKLSPIVWVSLLLIILFIPMQFFAPSGTLLVFGYVNQIVANVSGQVIEVPIEANQPLEEGDVLFRIDPRPYQLTVDKLEAALVEAGVGVSQLLENLRAAQANTGMARANLLANETDLDRRARQQLEAALSQVDSMEASLEGSLAQVTGTKANLDVARADLARMQQAAASEAVSRQLLDSARRQVETLEAQLEGNLAQVEGVRAAIETSKAQARSAELALESGSDRIQQASEQYLQAQAGERSARLAYEAEIGGLNPRLQQVAADLEAARLNLDWTTVRAPANGFVANLQLRPGSRVGAIPFNSVMSFVNSEKTIVAVEIPQTRLRHIRPGQSAEVALSRYPGKIFNAKALVVVEAQGQGQLKPSGQLPAQVGANPNAPFAVRLELLDFPKELPLPIGSGGSAAIYTEHGKATHVIRRVVLRMDSIMNYLF